MRVGDFQRKFEGFEFERLTVSKQRLPVSNFESSNVRTFERLKVRKFGVCKSGFSFGLWLATEVASLKARKFRTLKDLEFELSKNGEFESLNRMKVREFESSKVWKSEKLLGGSWDLVSIGLQVP